MGVCEHFMPDVIAPEAQRFTLFTDSEDGRHMITSVVFSIEITFSVYLWLVS